MSRNSSLFASRCLFIFCHVEAWARAYS